MHIVAQPRKLLIVVHRECNSVPQCTELWLDSEHCDAETSDDTGNALAGHADHMLNLLSTHFFLLLW